MKPFYDPGRLNRQVFIMTKTDAVDAIGQPLDTWTILRTAWADIRHPKGLEAVKADSSTSVVSASIRIRYCTDVHSGMRVHHGSVVYMIDAVLPDEQERKWTDLVCKRVD